MTSEFNDDFIWLKDMINSYREKYEGFLPSGDEDEFIDKVKKMLELYREKQNSIGRFGRKILGRFYKEKELFGRIHSYSFRLKDRKHLAQKIIRKK